MPRKSISPVIAWVALVVISATSLTAQAAMMTLSDPNSDFTVTFDTEQTGLFGTPVLSYNTIFFVPNDFTATSTNGQGQFITTSTINLRLDAVTNGFTLDQFSLQERGDYILDGAGAEVSVLGEMRLFAAENPFVDFVDHIDTGPLTINDGDNHDWTGNANIGSTDGWTGSSSVFLTLENILIASTSSPNSLAFVQKKFEGVQITVSSVPVPPALILFGSSLLMVFGWRRK